MEQKIKIVMLVGEAKSSTFMYNGLSKDFVIEKVVRETPVSMKQILKNRAKKLGYFMFLVKFYLVFYCCQLSENFLKIS